MSASAVKEECKCHPHLVKVSHYIERHPLKVGANPSFGCLDSETNETTTYVTSTPSPTKLPIIPDMGAIIVCPAKTHKDQYYENVRLPNDSSFDKHMEHSDIHD